MDAFSLNHKVVLITGGSRGLGRSLALQMAARGAVTIICGRNQESLSRTAAGIKDCYALVADVSSSRDVQLMFASIVDQFARVDVLVNNAGLGVYRPLLELSEEDFTSVINVNLIGAFLCSQTAGRVMRDQGGGCIVNVLSGAAEVGIENLSAYCASKHALLGLTKCMEIELAELNIRVVAISPGFIRGTGFFDTFPPDYRIPDDAPSPDTVAEGIVKILERAPKAGIREVVRKASRRLLAG